MASSKEYLEFILGQLSMMKQSVICGTSLPFPHSCFSVSC